MHLEASGPLPCGTVAWRARAAGEVLTVVCKATYDLQPGACVLRAVQEPLRERDQPYGDDPRRPTYAPADLIPFKPRAEIMLVGSAFAPGGAAATSLVVRLAAAGVDKSIEVHAERRRYPNGQVVCGAPFTRASLGWDQAAAALTNPIGVRSDIAVDAHGGVALPRLVMPQAPPGPPFVPAGFGPVAPQWPGRLEKLGRSGLHAWPRSWNDATLADDLNPQFFQVAPADQRPHALRADEPLLLMHMHPVHARLATRLPGMFPAAWVERAGCAPETLALVADTLWIDTDRALCTLTWRGRVRLAYPGEAGVVRVRMQEPAATAPASDPIAAAMRRAQEEDDSSTVRLDKPASGAPVSLPVAARPQSSGGTHQGADPIAAAIVAAREQTDATAYLAGAPPPGPAMPFVTGPAAVREAEAFAEKLSQVVTEARKEYGATRPVSDADVSAPVLPFEGRPLIAVPPAPTPEPDVTSERIPSAESPGTAPPAPVVAAPKPPPPAPSRALEPPAMIGPLATPEMAVQAAVETKPQAPATAEAPAPSVPPAAPPEKPALPVDRFPIERCAAIAARVACRKADEQKILEENELDAATWDQLKKHWDREIGAETRRGKVDMLAVHDRAYVAQIEKERGPITVEEYARLVVANERATADDVLRDMKLPRGATMRVDRVWTERAARDAKLERHVKDAICAERQR